MNKIQVIEDKYLKSGEYSLNIENDVVLNLQGETIIHDINSHNKELDIKIANASKVSLYQLKELDKDYNIHITIASDAEFNYNLVILNKNNHNLSIDFNMVGNNSKAYINLRALNTEEDSNLNIICKGYVKKNTQDNELIENLKGLITNDSSIKISPIMLVDTSEVSANHLVTIGTFNVEELFYLKILGLSDDMARDMLIKAFLTNACSKEMRIFLGGDEDE